MVDNKDTKQEELKHLYRLLYERNKEFERAKGKRAILTIIGFAIFFFIVIYCNAKLTGIYILAAAAFSVFIAGLHVVVNAAIFGHLANIGRNEKEILSAIKKKIDDLEKTL